MKIEVIRHYGVPFINNATAKLIATGITPPHRVDPVAEIQARSNRPGPPKTPRQPYVVPGAIKMSIYMSCNNAS